MCFFSTCEELLANDCHLNVIFEHGGDQDWNESYVLVAFLGQFSGTMPSTCVYCDIVVILAGFHL